MPKIVINEQDLTTTPLRVTNNNVVFVEHGRSHDKYLSKETGAIIIVPRHAKEIPKGTAEKILKDAGIKR